MNLPTLNYKKLGLIVAFAAVIILAAYFLYAFFFKATLPPTGVETPSENTPGAGLPQAGSGTPGSGTGSGQNGGELPGSGSSTPGSTGSNGTPSENGGIQSAALAEQASHSFVNQNGQVGFYNAADSRFYTLDNQGRLVTLSDKQFYGVQNVTWSSVGQKAILEYPDGSKIRYDFERENQVTLPKHWESFEFSPAGDQIVAKSIGLDPDNRWLVVANDDGSKARQIEPLGDNADNVISSWSPNGQSVALFVDGVDFDRKEVYFIGQNGENFKSTVVEGRGFEPLWSPDGKQLLYSVYSSQSDYKPSLWLVGAQGDSIGSNRRPLELNTWADKCSFAGSSLYCAVPASLERGAGMFGSENSNSQDVLYRINVSTGLREPIPLDGSYSMSDLSLSPDGTYLYFIDSITKQLRKVKVK